MTKKISKNPATNSSFEQLFYKNKAKINKIFSIVLMLASLLVVLFYVISEYSVNIMGAKWCRNILLVESLVVFAVALWMYFSKIKATVVTMILSALLIALSGLLYFLYSTAITLFVVPILIATMYFDKKIVLFNSIAVFVIFVIVLFLGIFLDRVSGAIRALHEYESIVVYDSVHNAMTFVFIPKMLLLVITTVIGLFASSNGKALIFRQAQSLNRISAMQQELTTAAELQKSILPEKSFATKDGFLSLFAQTNPAKETAGDFYDYFYVDDNTLAFLVADISDKGASAAMFMMLVKSTISSCINNNKDLRQSVETVNTLLCENNKDKMFTTLWIGYVNITNGDVQYVNAGHPYPVVIHENGGIEVIENEPDVFMGAFKNVLYEVHSFSLQKGDKLFLYTDGATDAMNGKEEPFGTDRLYGVLSKKYEKAEGVCRAVFSAVSDFTQNARQFDDITVMCVGIDKEKKEEKNRLVLFATEENIEKAIDVVNRFIENHCSENTRRQIDVAIDEICSNICNYAVGTVNMVLQYRIIDKFLEMEFIDDGQEFNPLLHVYDDGNPLRLGGNGIMLVRTLMDKVDYQRINNKNVLFIRKNLEETER